MVWIKNMFILRLRPSMWTLLLPIIAISVPLLVRVRVAQNMQNYERQRLHTQQVGQLHYELYADGDIRVRHAQGPSMHNAGLRLPIADWREMQLQLEELIHGLEN
jgi:hypothetical protein